jgi:hypothetical protein
MKKIPGFTNWLACPSGKIWSKKRKRYLRGSPDKDGYILHGYLKNGIRLNAKAHRLICLAFHGKPPVGRNLVNHDDLNKSNNAPPNLSWSSNFENSLHARSHGIGFKIPFEKLIAIKNEYKRNVRGFGAASLSRKYGVSQSHLTYIFNGKSRIYG